MLKLATIELPDQAILSIAEKVLVDPTFNLARLHFYNFGGLNRTMKFLTLLEKGEFEISDSRKKINLATEL